MAGSREQQVTTTFDEVFGKGEAPDVLGRVVASDRRRSGRGQEAVQEEAPAREDAVSHEDYKLTSKPVSQQAYNEASAPEAADAEPTQAPRRPRSPARKTAAAPANALAERVATATELATSSSVTVSFRMPQELNKWLDAYVHESWPARVKKQDLLTEALRMLIARRGKAGEEILATELLPEKEP